eukprot:scaffold189450_cov32-Tisochrysis_lutea.AAC.2
MGADSKRSGGERTVFTEVEGEDAVRKELIRLLPKRLGGGKGTDSLDEMLRDAGLTPFASFETVCWPITRSSSPTELCVSLFVGKVVVPPDPCTGSFWQVRTKLRIHGVAIDADEASFGHSVVEVEVMCDSEDQVDSFNPALPSAPIYAHRVPAAEVRIAQVASAMGLQSLDGGSGGKLETYIRRFCPEVFNNLVEAGILRT